MRDEEVSRWVTASELAEYAYCPRAWWYRRDPPASGPTRESLVRADAGSRYHATVLGATVRRERTAGWLAAGAVVAALAVGALVVFAVVG